ncbi:MAG: AarF/ABC1/UbiB kinase family protein [Verrucomicrobia bacterium]|nr:AarF/ABC1/UbiB kinase family protein [Verrucomicrobiota bacterium]MBV9673859.1 AarF/ABC1/UbiB kinase family protein [Verrucomicrobiota bacterium]
MKDRIPVSKAERSAKILSTGVKVGVNYVTHYSKRLAALPVTREQLDRLNAEDIYLSLSELKGSALKVAQLLSVDHNIMPKAYADLFAASQYSAPPLSGPLIIRTFRRALGRAPAEVFDFFDPVSVQAASIGQVHRARLNDSLLAVKIQYPGVRESISSDLKLIRPFALRLLDIKGRDLDVYMREVEERILEETDYELELKRSIHFSNACSHLENIRFAKYYPEFSGRRVITMDWLEGRHLKEFLALKPDQETRNRVGQALWDFYNFQQHRLRAVHADPHPGNFLVLPDGSVSIIDFGCIKLMPNEFYRAFFSLTRNDLGRGEIFALFERLEMFLPSDTAKERESYGHHCIEMMNLAVRPFREASFDFADPNYFRQIYLYGDRISRMQEFKKPRGSKHFIYVNRTNFGLFNILHQLGVVIQTDRYRPEVN